MISLRCDAMSPSSAVARLSRCEESCEVTFLSPTRTIRLTRRDSSASSGSSRPRPRFIYSESTSNSARKARALRRNPQRPKCV